MLKKIQIKVQNHPRPKLMLFIAFIIAALLMITFMRVFSAIMLRKQTNAQLTPLVNVITAARAPLKEEITLPGNVMAWHEAPIYARTNGYIKIWYVDIGYRVNKGDVLAVIETPELDAQLRQAKADLKVVSAQNKLAQTTAVRWKNLLKTDSVSKQETDEKVDTASAMQAAVAAARANRDRLSELVGFEQVIAPFKGIISARATDIGALINIGSAPAEQKPLFRVVQIDPLRVYVKIPQTYSSRINSKMEVSLQFAEHPGVRFPARLLETAHAIDPVTRTLLAEFVVENKKGELLPGGYTEVHFSIPSYPEAVRLPVSTLIFQKAGLQVATLDKTHHVVLKNIVVHRDFGTFVEVVSGVEPGEKIIINPPDAIYNGEYVQVVTPHGEQKLAF